MALIHKEFTIICGHYGCGKTNLSINLAIDAVKKGCKTTLVDMDIVNPYFRSSDYAEMLMDKGVRVIAPKYARTTLDLPMLVPEVQSVFEDDGVVIIDAGGDDAGATALGRYAESIQAVNHDMLYVINRYRVLSTKAEQAVQLLREIETASHLKTTAIINNSHLMGDTTPETIADSLAFAEETSRVTGLPVRATVAPAFLAGRLGGDLDPERLYYVDVYVRPPWTEDV